MSDRRKGPRLYKSGRDAGHTSLDPFQFFPSRLNQTHPFHSTLPIFNGFYCSLFCPCLECSSGRYCPPYGSSYAQAGQSWDSGVQVQPRGVGVCPSV